MVKPKNNMMNGNRMMNGNLAIFIVDVYEFNSGSRNMVFREIERIAL